MFMCWYYKMTTLSVFDEFFLYDDDENLANTTLSTSFTKFDFKPMSDYLLGEWTKIVPLRCKITNFFGKQYFKTLTVEEYAKCWPNMCIEVKGIHT